MSSTPPQDSWTPAVASDPATPQQTLADIAYRRPDLRVYVAANPNLYPGLRQWLTSLGDPAVDAILAGPPAVAPAPPAPVPLAPALEDTVVAPPRIVAGPAAVSAPGVAVPTPPTSRQPGRVPIWAVVTVVIAAVVVVALIVVLLLVRPFDTDPQSAPPPSPGASVTQAPGSSDTPSAEATQDKASPSQTSAPQPTASLPGACDSSPTAQVQSIKATDTALVASLALSAGCPGGQVLDTPQLYVRLAGPAAPLAAGYVDMSGEPLIIPGGAPASLEVTFPADNFWVIGAPPTAAQVTATTEQRSPGVQPYTGPTVDSVRATVDSGAGTDLSPADTDQIAAARLQAQRQHDLPILTAQYQGHWVSQLSSKQPGLQAEGITWDNNAIWQHYSQIAQQYPGALLLWSGDFSSYRNPDWWIVVAGPIYDNPDAAIAWCQSAGLDYDHCYAKFISTTSGPDGATVMQPQN